MDPLYSDSPLKSPVDDSLGYAEFAKSLAQGIVRMSPEDGFVMGLYGEWGSGKSTVINFISAYIDEYDEDERPLIFPFNPWWFTNTEDLITAFFSQLLVKLKQTHWGQQISKLAKNIRGLATVVSSIPGGELAGLAGAGIDLLSKPDIVALKTNIADRLKKRGKKILVILDDIDRLSRDEMLQIFTLVKAIANFPFVTYLLAFDKNIVTETIKENGDLYLEKIVQAAFELPPPSKAGLETLLIAQLEHIVGKLPEGFYARFMRDLMGDHPALLGTMRTPRRIVRFINTLRITYPAIQGEVYVTDFVLLEFLRLYHPEVYLEIRRNKVLVTTASNELIAEAKAQLRRRLNSLTGDSKNLKILVEELFPDLGEQSGAWLRRGSPQETRVQRRVSDKASFDTYFRFAVDDDRTSLSDLNLLVSNAEEIETLRSGLSEHLYHSPAQILDLLNSLRLGSTKLTLVASRNFLKVIFDVADLCLKLNEQREVPYIHEAWIHLALSLLTNLPRETCVQEFRQFAESGKASYFILGMINESWIEIEAIQPEVRILQATNEAKFDDIALGRIREITSQADFFDILIWQTVIYMWFRIEETSARIWLREKLKIARNLIDFLGNFLSRSVGEPMRFGKRFSPEIERYIPIPELYKIAEETFQDADLPEELALLAQAFLDTLREAAKVK